MLIRDFRVATYYTITTLHWTDTMGMFTFLHIYILTIF